MAIDLYKNRCAVYDEGEKPYIFISYSHKDLEKVVSLIRKLQSLGFRIWYDSGVPAGAEWPEEIATHLKNSGCVLSLLSANAAKSRHFKEEFNYAYHLQKPILVAYLEDCELTPGIEMRVVSQQCIKCEHCESDDDLLEEIARAKILLPCLGEKPDAEPSAAPDPDPKLQSNTSKSKIDQIRAKAEKGDMNAQNDLGYAYSKGEGVAQDKAEAFKWYSKAAKQGFSYAQFNLGLFYARGISTEQNWEEAVRFYQLAADQNHTGALNNLAACYELGNGVQKDIKKAVEFYRKAAELGSSDAQWNLGRCIQSGTGVPQDWEEAVRWFRKAADQGYANAQQRMAKCYREGLGVPIDEAEAARWQKLYDENPNK